MIWGLRQPRANRSNHSARLRVTRTQCEHASSRLGFSESGPEFRERCRLTLSRQKADYQLDLALEGCGRHCVTTISRRRGRHFEINSHKYSIGLMIVGKLVWQQEEVRTEDISIALMIREEFFTSELFKDTLEAILLILRYRTM